MPNLTPLDEALEIVLSHTELLPVETVDLVSATGRVAAADLKADIDNAPYGAAGMDGFAVRAAQLEGASEDNPVVLEVFEEVAAGDYYEGDFADDQCLRIMTGACVPDCADTVVKYEIVQTVEGDGRKGSKVAFSAPAKLGNNVREPGEDAKAGETVVHTGEVINSGGVGFLASCGIVEVPTYKRPRVAIMATGSELVDPTEIPGKGKIRNSNSSSLAACLLELGCEPVVLPIVRDEYDVLLDAVQEACDGSFDYVLTTGGACEGDYDFITDVIAELGEVYLTTVNMRPGKAETFGVVNGVSVFGLPGNPAAAWTGFHMLVRPALRKMQGYTKLERQHVNATLTGKIKAKKDSRFALLRARVERDENGGFTVTPNTRQSSGLFGPLQQSNALLVIPRGDEGHEAGEVMECILVDVPEEAVL